MFILRQRISILSISFMTKKLAIISMNVNNENDNQYIKIRINKSNVYNLL